MAYIGHVSNVLDAVDRLGCGKTCGCAPCRTRSTLSEWYIEDDDEDEEDEDDDNADRKPDPLLGASGALAPEETALEHRIARARAQWRPVVQGGPRRYVDRQLGAIAGPMRLGLHPGDLASLQHLGWVGLTAPPGTQAVRLVEAIATCLRELGKPDLVGNAGAMAACVAGYLSGPMGAPIAWRCLRNLGGALSLASVARLLSCVAASMTPRPEPLTRAVLASADR